MDNAVIHFKKLERKPHIFFALLPQDWQQEIVPWWQQHGKSNSAQVFVLESDGQVKAGGIVFSTIPPGTQNISIATELLNKGYLYIGFLWVPENHRGLNFGSMWLHRLKDRFPGQRFWLYIEDFDLQSFYEKSGFRFYREITTSGRPERLFLSD